MRFFRHRSGSNESYSHLRTGGVWMTAQPKDEGPVWSDTGPSDAQTFDANLNRFAALKSRGLAFASYIRDRPGSSTGGRDGKTWRERSQRIERCGSWLLFRHWLHHDRYTLKEARFCSQHLLCPLCAVKRGSLALRAYLQAFEALRAQKPHLRAFLVTVTVRDGESLLERFAWLMNSWRTLWYRFRHPDEYPHTFLARLGCIAGVASVETKIGRNSGLWHPHIHAVLCTENGELAWEDLEASLRAEWKSITGDSFECDVTPIDLADPSSAFSEICKYALKLSDLANELLVEAFGVLHGQRLRETYGQFRGIEIPEELTDADLDGPFRELVARFTGARGEGRYDVSDLVPPPRRFSVLSAARQRQLRALLSRVSAQVSEGA